METRALVAEYTFSPDAALPALRRWRDLNTDAPREATLSEKLTRLTVIKNTYDPYNVFHLNQNIPPSR